MKRILMLTLLVISVTFASAQTMYKATVNKTVTLQKNYTTYQYEKESEQQVDITIFLTVKDVCIYNGYKLIFSYNIIKVIDKNTYVLKEKSDGTVVDMFLSDKGIIIANNENGFMVAFYFSEFREI